MRSNHEGSLQEISGLSKPLQAVMCLHIHTGKNKSLSTESITTEASQPKRTSQNRERVCWPA